MTYPANMAQDFEKGAMREAAKGILNVQKRRKDGLAFLVTTVSSFLESRLNQERLLLASLDTWHKSLLLWRKEPERASHLAQSSCQAAREQFV